MYVFEFTPADVPPDGVLLCVEEEICGSDELLVVMELESELEKELSLLDGAFVLPKKVLDSSEEPTGFAGYVGGPKDGELEDELFEELDEEDEEDLLDDLELLEEPEELSSSPLSVEELVCELGVGSSVEVYSDILPGRSEPETYELFASIILPLSSPPCEQPASIQIAAASEIMPLILFFIDTFPQILIIL